MDKRADIWAFGCILFEMLTGRRAFAGDNQSDVAGGDPQGGAGAGGAARGDTVRDSPPRPARVCRRIRPIGFGTLATRGCRFATRGRARTGANPPRSHDILRVRREALAWLMAALAAVWLMLRPGVTPSETRVEIGTPPTASPLSAAISPDGQSVAFVGLSGSESRLWVRPMRAESQRPLQGTEGAESPSWSPDSKSIRFFADGALKRIDLDGGSVRTLAYATAGTDGSWGSQNVILFAARGNPIVRLPAEGGEPTVVSGLKRGSTFSPHFLPDGRRFLDYLRGSPEVRGVYVGDLDITGQERRLFDSDSGAMYASSGHLLFVMKGTLFAQPFDSNRLTVAGDPFPVAEDVAAHTGLFVSSVSVSTTGAIAYRRSSAPDRRQLVWFDRSGKEIQPLAVRAASLISRRFRAMGSVSCSIAGWTATSISGRWTPDAAPSVVSRRIPETM